MIGLEVGKSYKFKVLRTSYIPPDEEYLVLKDPFGNKHLMPTRYYNNYNIENQEYLNCYVDKINCKGQIFLDPEHPVYKIGEIYDFSYIGIETRTTKHGDKIKVIVVEDVYNQKCTILPFEWQLSASYQPQKVKCKLVRIKKGRLYLENVEKKNSD